MQSNFEWIRLQLLYMIGTRNPFLPIHVENLFGIVQIIPLLCQRQYLLQETAMKHYSNKCFTYQREHSHPSAMNIENLDVLMAFLAKTGYRQKERKQEEHFRANYLADCGFQRQTFLSLPAGIQHNLFWRDPTGLLRRHVCMTSACKIHTHSLKTKKFYNG